MKVTSKKCIPKWVPPEKRMRKYRKNMKDPSKVKWTKFMIVVPTQEDKEQLQACFEYLHDSEIMDCPEDFIVLNQIAHCYLDEEREPGCVSLISVNPELYKNLYNKLLKKKRQNEKLIRYQKIHRKKQTNTLYTNYKAKTSLSKNKT